MGQTQSKKQFQKFKTDENEENYEYVKIPPSKPKEPQIKLSK